MAARKGAFRPPSITTYVVGFASLAAVLFGLLAVWMFYRMDAASQASEQVAQQAAREEMRHAIEMVLDDAVHQATELAVWSETLRQFQSPDYPHWRDNDALSATFVPDYVDAVALYGPAGKILVADNRFPGSLPEGRTYLSGSSPHYLYYFRPLSQPEIGSLGLRITFLHSLTERYRFRYIDAGSLTISGDSGRIPPTRIPAALHYDLRRNIDIQPLQRVLLDTVTHFGLLAVGLGIAMLVLLRRLIGNPLQRLVQHIDTLHSGRLSDDPPPLPVAELEKLRDSLDDYQRDLAKMHTRLDRKNKQLWRLAHRDSLTGAFNRRAFDEDWRQLLPLIRERPNGVAVMLIDCDHFKAINDSYGHDVGDRVIRAVAHTLASALREDDRLYRLGGDEFGVHLLDATPAEAEQVARRCLAAVDAYPFRKLGIREPVRFSIGIAHAEGADRQELTDLRKRADVAMYQAKRPGSDKVVHYRPEMAGNRDSLVCTARIEAVYQAVETGEGLQPHYQPVRSLPGARLPPFHEALARIRSGDRLILPAEIFPIVEARRLETEFDLAVISQITQVLESSGFPEGLGISINIAGDSLLNDKYLERLVALRPYLTAHPLIIEVTETALITRLVEVSGVLARMRRLGFRVALDDFGSGYSSLRYLASMPVDLVKLDITMVHDLERDKRQRCIVENLVRMILEAGYQLVAEGVETPVMLERVSELGFTHVQGFLLGRPSETISGAA